MMKRYFSNYLAEWKERENRKPLIVRGARQVGKTYSIELFGSENFLNMVTVNFDETPEVSRFFSTNDVLEIIRNFEVYYSTRIEPGTTLLFLDEIQACPEAIPTLRYFHERAGDLHVIAAGSLLDHTLNEIRYSMPVGRVEFAYMYPMSFYEFLEAVSEEKLVEYLGAYALGEEIASPIHEKLLRLHRLYCFVGGMPEAVKDYSKSHSLVDAGRIHESILKSLEFDFAKYGTRAQQQVLVKLLRFLPKSTGGKFRYSRFDRSLRAESIRSALELLERSRICNLIHHTNAPGLPLETGKVEKTFKTLFLDSGLASHCLKVLLTNLDDVDLVNTGRIAEQFVGQELRCAEPWYIEPELYYWTREKKSSMAEIDYLVQAGGQMMPIEVKAGKTGTLKSLHLFMYEMKLSRAVRFYTGECSVSKMDVAVRTGDGVKNSQYELVSLPLYLVGEMKRILLS